MSEIYDVFENGEIGDYLLNYFSESELRLVRPPFYRLNYYICGITFHHVNLLPTRITQRHFSNIDAFEKLN